MATVSKRVKDNKGNGVGKRNLSPFLDTREYESTMENGSGSIDAMQMILQIINITNLTRRVGDTLCYKRLLTTRKTERLSRCPTGTQKRDKAEGFPRRQQKEGSSSVNGVMDRLIRSTSSTQGF
jgi:hypothetical protein